MVLDLEKGQLKVEVSFVNMYLHYLNQLNIAKLWEGYVQTSTDQWMENTQVLFDQGSRISLSK